MEVMVL